MKDDIKNTKEKLVGETALVKGMYCSYRGSESSSQQSCSLAHKPVTRGFNALLQPPKAYVLMCTFHRHTLLHI